MKKSASFYIEILMLLFVVLLACIVLVQMFGAAQSMSQDAAQLTQAVVLAQNAAENFAAGESTAESTPTLFFDENGQALPREDAGNAAYMVETVVTTDDTHQNLFHATISVSCGNVVLYTLETAKYLQIGNIK